MRLINADDFAERMLKQWDTADEEKKIEIVSVIANIVTPILVGTPTVDAVEVTRCKDCQAWGRSPYGHPTIGWCIVHGRHRSPDYFCASAKKRESVEVG